jgi:cystathionine beta-synthase
MRERGFIEQAKPKTALDLIAHHKDLPLVTVNEADLVVDACEKMSRYGISQIPVVNDNGAFTGSLHDSHLFQQLVLNPALKQDTVSKVMQPAFPFVKADASLAKVSKLLTRDMPAVMVTDLGGNTHIITQTDVIESIR